MSRVSAARVAWVAAAALLVVSCSGATGGAPGARPVESTVVQFNYGTVNPETVRIPADGNVSWTNLAPDTRGFVVFQVSIAASFRCADLRPYFSRVEDVYRSLPLTGEESERVELPCPLAPGSYAYEIWLKGVGFGDEIDEGKPDLVLRARIVVE